MINESMSKQNQYMNQYDKQQEYQRNDPWNHNPFDMYQNSLDQSQHNVQHFQLQRTQSQIPQNIGKYDLYLNISNQEFFRKDLLKRTKKEAYEAITQFIYQLTDSPKERTMLKIFIFNKLKEKQNFCEPKIYEQTLMEYGKVNFS